VSLLFKNYIFLSSSFLHFPFNILSVSFRIKKGFLLSFVADAIQKMRENEFSYNKDAFKRFFSNFMITISIPFCMYLTTFRPALSHSLMGRSQSSLSLSASSALGWWFTQFYLNNYSVGGEGKISQNAKKEKTLIFV
jgi:hypothetical protein